MPKPDPPDFVIEDHTFCCGVGYVIRTTDDVRATVQQVNFTDEGVELLLDSPFKFVDGGFMITFGFPTSIVVPHNSQPGRMCHARFN